MSAGRASAALAQEEDERAVRLLALGEERVALFGAEMRDVDPRRRIVGDDAEHGAGAEPLQPLAGLEHRQRAEQAAGVELGLRGRRGKGLVHALQLAGRAAALKALLAAPALADAPGPAVAAYVIVDAARIEESLTGAPGDPLRGARLYADRARAACALCHGAPVPAPGPAEGPGSAAPPGQAAGDGGRPFLPAVADGDRAADGRGPGGVASEAPGARDAAVRPPAAEIAPDAPPSSAPGNAGDGDAVRRGEAGEAVRRDPHAEADVGDGAAMPGGRSAEDAEPPGAEADPGPGTGLAGAPEAPPADPETAAEPAQADGPAPAVAPLPPARALPGAAVAEGPTPTPDADAGLRDAPSEAGEDGTGPGPGASAAGTPVDLAERDAVRGPRLDRVGARLAPGEIRLWLVAPQVLAPGTPMPAYHAAGQRRGAEDPLHGGPWLTAGEIENLVAYLSGLGTGD